MKTVKLVEMGDVFEYAGTTWQLTRTEVDLSGRPGGQLILIAIPAMTQHNGSRQPFDLEAAKAGAPVVTRDGRKVDELHHFTTEHTEHPVCAIIGGMVVWFSVEGTTYEGNHHYDLFMAPKPKRTKYANLYVTPRGNEWLFYDTPTYAEHAAVVLPLTTDVVATAVPVEIEE